MLEAAETTIKEPYPDSTRLSELINEDNDFLTAEVTAPISDSSIPASHARICNSESQLMGIRDLHHMMLDLFTTTETLRSEAAASELKLRGEVAAELKKAVAAAEQRLGEKAATTEQRLREEAATTEQRLREEAATTEQRLREEAAETEERLSKGIRELKDELAKEKAERRQNLDYIREVCVTVINQHILRSLYVFPSAYSAAYAAASSCTA